MSTRFAVIAGTLYGNRGAQAMIETVVGRLGEHIAPDDRILVLSYYPNDDRRVCTADHVDIRSSTPLALVGFWFPAASLCGALRRLLGGNLARRLAPAAVRELMEADALIDVAGISFIDGREKFLPFNVLTLLPAVLLGVPVVKMPQAIGPVTGRMNRLAACSVLPRLGRVWARGAVTESHLRSIGLDEATGQVGADIAFLHRPVDALTDEGTDEVDRIADEIGERRASGGDRGVIGVCPSSVLAGRNPGHYAQMFATVVDGLIEAGFAVVLFPNATRQTGGGERNNDLPLIGRITDRLLPDSRRHVLAVDGDISASEIKRVIERCDVVLTSRFHAMVGALASAVPVVVVGWSHKYGEVMAQFGLDEMVGDHRDADAVELLDRVLDTHSRRSELAAKIRAALPSVTASAHRPLDDLVVRFCGADERG